MIQRYLGIGISWSLIVTLVSFAYIHSNDLTDFITENKKLSSGALFALITSLVFAFRRRVKSANKPIAFFSETELMNFPSNKARYSDRIAYAMAELSELAYLEVEKENDNFVQFAELAKKTNASSDKTKALDAIIQKYRETLRTSVTNGTIISSVDQLATTLSQHKFILHRPYINFGSLQGFVCEYFGDEDPFIAVVFRGSEKKIEDWLTNADAVPMPNNEVKVGKVHSGFYQDFKSAKELIQNLITKIQDKHKGKDIPVFFTGHSKGGAIANIATRELMPDGNGACYTFGAPRLGDYEYFQFVKTPMYRVVNSSDIVPRVPPGAMTSVILKALTLIRYLLVRFPVVQELILKAEKFINQLKDYRHFGDLRYLTDVGTGKFDKVMLLRNPNYLDLCQWMWRHLAISLGLPIKSHGMGLYRKKLAEVGKRRLSEKSPDVRSFDYFHGD